VHHLSTFYAIAHELVASLTRDTGVVTYNSLIAESVAHAASLGGRCLARDFSLASCDSEATNKEIFPQLSRVDFDRFGMGVLAADMFLKTQAAAPETSVSAVAPGQWIPGETIGKT